MLVDGFEAKALTNEIAEYLRRFAQVNLGDDSRADIAELIRYHGGLEWNNITKSWFNPDEPDRPLKFNLLALRAEAESE